MLISVSEIYQLINLRVHKGKVNNLFGLLLLGCLW